MFTTILYGFDVYWLKTSQQSQHLFLLHISMTFTLPLTLKTFLFSDAMYLLKYVVKHKSAKILMTYAVGKLEATLNISHLILSTSNQRVS